MLITTLLALPATAAPVAVKGIASQAWADASFWLRWSGLATSITSIFSGQQGAPDPYDQEKQKDRDARVHSVIISPGDISLQLDERAVFAAVALDKDDQPVSGVEFKWSAQDHGRKREARISPRGEFHARLPGKVKITAEGAGKSSHIFVTVLDGVLNKRDEKKETKKEVSTRDLPSDALSGFTASMSVAPMLAQAESWDGSNYWSADDPGNGVGNPPGTPDDSGAGSGNFQLNAPVLDLPGRGSSLSLNLTYNSRLWNKAGSQITYDIDKDWPAPGWSLGFGKLIGMGVANGSMLIDPDGTRHGYSGTVTYGYNQSYTIFDGYTVDGKFINYTHQTGTGGALVWGEARLPDGTVIQYGASSQGALYPTRITDANGNYITITYRNNVGPHIQTVTDTLGRVVTFHYDANNLLTAITGLGLNGATRTLVRLHYRQISLNYGFSGLTPRVQNPSPWVVDAIYYPATGTGYWFGDADSYSSYGMIAKVSEQRSMSFSASSLTQQGTVSPIAMMQQKVYNYPMGPNYSLTDAPTYTTMNHTWESIDTPAAVTTYSVQQNASPRRTEITLPDGTRSVQLAHNSPGQFNDGLVYQEEVYSAAGALLSRNNVTWAQGAYSAPRPSRTQVTDQLGQVTATDYEYGASYNQVTAVRDYGYGGTSLLRTKRVEYENGAVYTSRHIFNLVKAVELYSADGTRASRTEYGYDTDPLTDAPDVVMHDNTYNPHAPQYLVPGYCYWECYDYCWEVCEPDYWTSDYNPATDYRGNVTWVKKYANAANLSGAIIETRNYDINGNMVLSSTSCCEQTRQTYTSSTQYAYVASKTRGDQTNAAARLTTSFVYDFNTGLVLSTTDANGRVSQTSYFANTLRPQQETKPTGAYKTYAYNDSAMTVSETTYTVGGAAIASQSLKYFNGIGKVRREEALADGGWDAVDIQYDSVGRVWRRTSPYRNGQEPQQWNQSAYDGLGRVTQTRAPDGSETNVYYNETTRPNAASVTPGQTTRFVDAWGRERWERKDSQGQLVEVVEPDPAGNGSVATGGLATRYVYTTLGKLVDVTQGSQRRFFRYDSLGRMTHQRLAEASATLNDAGQYVGAGSWSDVFTYDDRSNLTSRTDARGVRVIVSYNNDPLNRVQSVSYDTSGVGGGQAPVLPAASINYQYMNSGDVTRVDLVTVNGVGTEDFTYDGEGRINSKTVTLTSRPSHPFTIDYINDSLNRVADIRYPAQYGFGSAARKVAHQDYDVASRVNRLSIGGVDYASQFIYNANSQVTSLKIGSAGANQVTETYSYNAASGFLEGQTVVRGASTVLLNLGYGYLRPATSSGRTGQLTSVINNLDRNKDRGYTYDAVGRLVQARGGSTNIWSQSYAYDRYGNRTSVTASGVSAGAPAPSCSATQTLSTEQFVKNFFQGALGRQPNATELQRWNSTLRQAYWQGRESLMLAAQNLGWQLFLSQEYLNRNRSDRDYVYDLYWAYLQRGPDEGGWNNWTNAVPTNGRDNVRRGFDYSIEFGNKVASLCPTANPSGSPIPGDGFGSLSYDAASNRINTAGYSYDSAGNQTRAMRADGSWQRFEYDAAGRLVKVKDDINNTQATYTYGASNHRLITQHGDAVSGNRTYYIWNGDAVIAEYVETYSPTPQWDKSYVFMDERLLSTVRRNGSTEVLQNHHPDRLGTRLITNAADGTHQEQVALPFGVALDAESSGMANRRFTSYDRSLSTGQDYAVNRFYDPMQGRFTQVDPIGMKAASLNNPQSLNLYAYVNNDPINRVDPDGLFSFFKWIGNLFKSVVKAIVRIAVSIVRAVMAILNVALKIITKVLEFIWRCDVPDFAGLSLSRQNELTQRGVSAQQWNGLANKQRLGYFNIVAAIAAAGLSLLGWVVDWAAGGIRQDRVFFIAGAGANNLQGQVRGSSGFSRQEGFLGQLFGGFFHGEYNDIYRQNVFYRSLQMSFTPDGRRLEADLDMFNPQSGAHGALLHTFAEVIPNAVTGSKTNPYLVAYRSSWECK